MADSKIGFRWRLSSESHFWIIQAMDYPSYGLSKLWIIQAMDYPSYGLSKLWIIQAMDYPS
ncbi:MAG: hypothetical protein PHH78_00220, partial [Methanothrix sp.]|nr:hypothetical protein [Methanothrix sp.]